MAARGEVDKQEGKNSGFMGEYGGRVDIGTEWNLKYFFHNWER